MSDYTAPPSYSKHINETKLQYTNHTLRSSITHLLHTLHTYIQSTYTPDTYIQSLYDKIYYLEYTNTELQKQLHSVIQYYNNKQHDIQQLQQLCNNIANNNNIHRQSQIVLNTSIPLLNHAYSTSKCILSYLPFGSKVANLTENILYTAQSHVVPVSYHILKKNVILQNNNTDIQKPVQFTEPNISTSSTTSTYSTASTEPQRKNSIVAATQLETLLKLQTHIVAQLRQENAELKNAIKQQNEPTTPTHNRYRTRGSNVDTSNVDTDGFVKPESIITPNLTASMLQNAARKYSDA